MTDLALVVLAAVLAVIVPGGWQMLRRARADRRQIATDLAAIRGVLDVLPAISDVVVGTPGDPIRHRPSTPGVAERLDTLETALLSGPDGGMVERLARVEADLVAHLRTHGGTP
ncbi:putative membrane protein [Candidatus Protofrankia californiensis]|uniref:Putative membrane protein n=1 Tax=Candidatus Protofrankia californiensis TaxID=1839754 RepID=A0A1C3NU47_9ACTN|nr:putative membrane protein [Candidatus Protofrankia californiensis]